MFIMVLLFRKNDNISCMADKDILDFIQVKMQN